MFGRHHHRHHHHSDERGKEVWHAGRGRRGGGGPFGWGGDRGFGGGDFLRAGRMLAQGDLRLLALTLIAEQPRHGYEIIKVIEERTAGWYSPSPGVVYPTLTYLEDAGYVTSGTEGSKKLYTITEAGKAHLEENRDIADVVLKRFARIGDKVARARRMFVSGSEEDDARIPRGLEAALLHLRDVTAKRLETDPGSETDVLEVLMRAAREIAGRPTS